MGHTHTAFVAARKTLGILGLTACAASIAWAQAPDDAAARQYAALLQQISDLETSIAHQEVYLGTQEAEIASLQGQIERVPELIESVGPMLDKMKAAIGNEIEADLPFNIAVRFDRLAGLDELIADKDARPGDKMRRAMNIYDIEVSYGQTIQSYAGNHPVEARSGSRVAACEQDAMSVACGLSKSQLERLKAGETIASMADANELQDGDYLRYGRLSLAYMQNDGSEVYRYNPASKEWTEMTGSRALDVRRAMKMAKGEAPPAVLQAPIYLAN